MAGWRLFERDGVRLAGLDFGGAGLPAILLHGLAGHAGEWSETAEWLSKRSRVIALDARGHGRSERDPSDVTPEARAADVAFVVEQLGFEEVVLVGQSLGGQTALLVAAARPDLVRALVLADSGPAGGTDQEVAAVEEALRGWPVPFPSRAAAVEYFGGHSLAATTWAAGLEQRADGYWPSFNLEVVVRTLREASNRSYWKQWQAIRCPTLVIRAGEGTLAEAEVRAMAERLPNARIVEFADAKHDLHLDRPTEWQGTLSGFVDDIAPRATP